MGILRGELELDREDIGRASDGPGRLISHSRTIVRGTQHMSAL